jgi:transposase
VKRVVDWVPGTGPAPIAEEGMALIRNLYAIGAEICGTSPATRLSARILNRLDDWLGNHRARVSAKSPHGHALAYITKDRDGCCCFLINGRVEIDNTTVEHRIRPVALNRKNALFAGHDAGAEYCAVIASQTETCKMNAPGPNA